MSYLNAFFALILFLGCLNASEKVSLGSTPMYPVFTYAGDPCTTLTVNWQTLSELPQLPSVHVSTLPRKELAEPSEYIIYGKTSQLKGVEGRFYHRVHLKKLKPNTTYYLNLCDGDGSFLSGSPEYKVLTIPEDDSALRFVTGGDMGTSEDVRTLLRHASGWDPHFAIVGGDVAYANGQLGKAHLWDKWLEYYTEEMITSAGYTIPLIVGIGNHETRGMFEKSFKDAPFIPMLFGQDMQKNYFSRRFGGNLGLLMLDTNHTASHESQVGWIRQELESFKDVAHTAAVYHVPLYPSHRSFMGKYSEAGRKHWAEVFHDMSLTVAFENHDHTYKRTHLLKNGKVSEDGSGTLFLGDGCWGRTTREIDYGGRWYLNESASVQHFWCVDVSSEEMVYRAIDIKNRVFDVYPENHPESAAAREVRAGFKNTYMLPAECLSTSGYVTTGAKWSGGQTTIQVKNIFDHPMSYSLKPVIIAENVTHTGFSEEIFTLGAGESKTHAVSFTPMGEQPLSSGSIKLAFSIRAEMQRAEEVVKVYDHLEIPIRVK